jgi:Methylamine utilisation protein MauE
MKLIKFYFYSIASLLILTAVAKLISATGTSQGLSTKDPVFGITVQHLLEGVGMMELFVAAFLLISRNTGYKSMVALGVSACFLMYRAAYWLNAPEQPCPCLGTITERLHMNKDVLSAMMLVFAIYMFLGNLYLLIASPQDRSVSKSSETVQSSRTAETQA